MNVYQHLDVVAERQKYLMKVFDAKTDMKYFIRTKPGAINTT